MGSLGRLGDTEEAHHGEELDREFAASPEGQELDHEISEFFDTLGHHINETPNGIHIDNEAFEDIEDEADDVKAEFEKLEKTHWAQDYDEAFHALGETAEADDLHESLHQFENSSEGQALEGEFKDLDAALKEHVQVSDIPEEWKEDMFLF